MRRRSIVFKLIFLIVCAFAVTTLSVLLVADNQLTRIINDRQHILHEEKLFTILDALYRNNERLEKTGLIEAYTRDFQDTSLRDLRKSYYNNPSATSYPFIIDGEGNIVMHPELPRGDSSLKSSEMVRHMLSSSAGDFDYTYQGHKKWLHYEKFPAWNWVVGYTITWDAKYADALKFRNLLTLIMLVITALVVIVLSMVVARFMKPVSVLKDVSKAMAAGDLDQHIDCTGTDELGDLASSFSHMRDSIRQKITELKNAEERLSVTLRSIGDGVITTDTSGNVLMLNRIAEKLTGWSVEEAAGQPLDEVFKIINEKTREKCESPFSKVISSGQIVGLAPHTVLLTKDGRELRIADSGAPIFNSEFDIIGMVLVFRDMTERLKTEKELLKIKKLESIGVLAGGIAHDFNNILTAILGNISLALFDKELSDRNKKILSDAEKASLRAKGLTQQLLTFSKGGEPVKETSSLVGIIKDSAHFVLHGHNTLCSYDFGEDIWLVDVDKGQISQVIQNIVLNASHAMPEGGTISITCENFVYSGEEFLPFSKDERFVKINIQDTGIGIPDNVVERIFDPYFSTKREGSGLGLAIAQSILDKHNGYVYVESVQGVGTSFMIYLPSSDRSVKLTHEKAPEEIEVKRSKILIMDDEEMVQTVTKKMLDRIGHEAVTVSEGMEAIETYQESMASGHPFDVVIMDLTIPGGMGGKEAVQEILRIDPDAKVVVASGYSSDPIMAKYKDYGFCAAITKPFQLKELSSSINHIMSS